MKEFVGEALERFGEDVGNRLRAGANNRLNAEYFDGFDKAANICEETIAKRIEKLYKQINDGNLLSAQEQFLLAQLNELKREIEDRVR